MSTLAAPATLRRIEPVSAAAPSLVKKMLAAGAGVLSSRTAHRLKTGNAVRQQQRTFRELTGRFARTSFWRADGISRGMSYDQFQSALPIRTYEDFAPAIERMKRGEADVLWPGRCAHYAVSSGTTSGRTKYLPVTRDMIAHFRRAGLDSLLYYTTRVGHAGVFRGRHLFLGGASTLTPIAESKPFAAYAGDLSGITALNLPRWVERHLYEPGAAIAQMSDWPAKIAAIAGRTAPLNISLLAGIPSWVLILAEALRLGSARATPLQSLWPDFECFIHGGVPIAPFHDELRATLGPGVNFHEVYPASEAFIATQDAEPEAGLRLMSDAGIFYEFLPLDDFDENRLGHLGARAVPLEGVQTGIDYVLLLSTPAGLARYVIGDVVRFTSVHPPRVVYVGRTKLQLSAFGEHVIEKELTDALTAVCRRQRLTPINFHVAPLFVDPAAGRVRGAHEWWLELKSSATGQPPLAMPLATELDAELQRLNDDYEAKRLGGGLAKPFVRLVAPGHFERWQRAAGKWGGQSKMPRCRSDRAVANALAAAFEK